MDSQERIELAARIVGLEERISKIERHLKWLDYVAYIALGVAIGSFY